MSLHFIPEIAGTVRHRWPVVLLASLAAAVLTMIARRMTSSPQVR